MGGGGIWAICVGTGCVVACCRPGLDPVEPLRHLIDGLLVLPLHVVELLLHLVQLSAERLGVLGPGGPGHQRDTQREHSNPPLAHGDPPAEKWRRRIAPRDAGAISGAARRCRTRRGARVGVTSGSGGPDGNRRDGDRGQCDERGSGVGSIGDETADDGGQRREVVIVVVEAGARPEVLVSQRAVAQEEGHQGQREEGDAPMIHRHAGRQSSPIAIHLQRLSDPPGLTVAGSNCRW